MMTVPPLWRDVDAYTQIAAQPGASTILLHGPLYCRLARLPLWIGQLGGANWIGFDEFMSSPRLTDPGIYLLLGFQHIGLCLAAYYLISALSSAVVIRVGLSIFFASQPLFYGYAHCIGSESLSMILILLLAGLGLRIVQSFPAVKASHCLLAGCILFCCVTTRHINAVLAGLLPFTFILLACARWVVARNPSPTTTALPSSVRQHAWICGLAIATGLVALLLASGYTHALSRKANVKFRSRVGFTFLWRLNFLSLLTPSDRALLLEQTAKRTHLPQSRQLLSLLKEWTDHHQNWVPDAFLGSARRRMGSVNGGGHSVRFDRMLNDTATAFLLPPSQPLVEVAWRDFRQSFRLTEGGIARYLFYTTEYLQSKHSEMPGLAALATFRQPTKVMRFLSAPYFRLWEFLSFRGWCGLWLLALALPWIVRRPVTPHGQMATVIYACVLVGMGLLMTLLNCFFAHLLPRFGLPMMELLLVSFIILLGSFFSSIRVAESQGDLGVER